jgi:ATP dependent DNA ligase-like protein
MLYAPMPLVRVPEPFNHLDWIYELKHDGFRALAYVEGHRRELVSRRGHAFKRWDVLKTEISHGIRAHSAVLDGEIVCLAGRRPNELLQAAVPSRLAVLLRVRRPLDTARIPRGTDPHHPPERGRRTATLSRSAASRLEPALAREQRQRR